MWEQIKEKKRGENKGKKTKGETNYNGQIKGKSRKKKFEINLKWNEKLK